MSDIPIKDYFEMRIEALEKATTLAALQMDKRLEGMNEFRTQLKDQGQTFLTRAEMDIVSHNTRSEISLMKDDIRILREAKAQMEGKASQQSVQVSLVFAIIGILIGIASLMIKK